MKRQSGFTLVELMIVIGILGVIATLSFPIYADYVHRGKVAEAVRLLGGLKTPMIEYYFDSGAWPSSPKVIGGRSHGTYTSYIISGGAEPIFYVEATMRGSIGEAAVSGLSLRMTFNTETEDWDCITAGVQGQPIPQQYLPAPCHPGF